MSAMACASVLFGALCCVEAVRDVLDLLDESEQRDEQTDSHASAVALNRSSHPKLHQSPGEYAEYIKDVTEAIVQGKQWDLKMKDFGDPDDEADASPGKILFHIVGTCPYTNAVKKWCGRKAVTVSIVYPDYAMGGQLIAYWSKPNTPSMPELLECTRSRHTAPQTRPEEYGGPLPDKCKNDWERFKFLEAVLNPLNAHWVGDGITFQFDHGAIRLIMRDKRFPGVRFFIYLVYVADWDMLKPVLKRGRWFSLPAVKQELVGWILCQVNDSRSNEFHRIKFYADSDGTFILTSEPMQIQDFWPTAKEVEHEK